MRSRLGNSGRLGAGTTQHTQYAFTNIKDLSGMSDSGIITVALGQDHTLSLSKSGSVLSWGLNLFLQLRYALDGDISQTDRNESQVP